MEMKTYGDYRQANQRDHFKRVDGKTNFMVRNKNINLSPAKNCQ